MSVMLRCFSTMGDGTLDAGVETTRTTGVEGVLPGFDLGRPLFRGVRAAVGASNTSTPCTNRASFCLFRRRLAGSLDLLLGACTVVGTPPATVLSVRMAFTPVSALFECVASSCGCSKSMLWDNSTPYQCRILSTFDLYNLPRAERNSTVVSETTVSIT